MFKGIYHFFMAIFSEGGHIQSNQNGLMVYFSRVRVTVSVMGLRLGIKVRD